jgi:hypothetical protein
MTPQSDQDLRFRNVQLIEQGVLAGLDEGPTVSELLEIVGDLTLYQIKRLADLAVEDNNNAILAKLRNEPPPPPALRIHR